MKWHQQQYSKGLRLSGQFLLLLMLCNMNLTLFPLRVRVLL